MSHPSPVLSHDVLRTAVEYVGTKTLLSLMLCCRAHYQVGVPALLAKPAVCLGQAHWPVKKMPRIVWSFLPLMSADRLRWQSLRGLIFGRMLRPDEVELLAEGIKHAPNIAHLEFRLSDDLLSTYPDLHAALMSLKNVQHFRISGATKHACLFLESVQWPLVTAELHQCRHSVPSLHPAALLRGAQNALVQLTCKDWTGCG